MPEAAASSPGFDLLAITASLSTWERDAAAVPLDDLSEPSSLAVLMERHRRSAHGTQQAAASLWSQGCFNTLLIPTVALVLTRTPQDCALPCFHRCRMSFCPKSGVARRLVLCRRAQDPDLAPESVLDVVMTRHVTPLIASLSTVANLADRVLWDNVGYVLAWTLNEAMRLRPDTSAACEALAESLQEPAGASRAMTALRGSVHARQPYARRTCCLRYALPGFDRCPGLCPATPDGRCRRS